MKNRPWPIIVLALIQILMPAFSILLNALLVPVSPLTYLSLFIEVRTLTEILLFFLPFPIAGIAILAMKSWSYPVFLAVMLWTMGSNFWLWFSNEAITDSFVVLLLISLVNLAFVTYYLLPAVRTVYFDRRLRWWENQPRFAVSFPGSVKNPNESHECALRDLSEGGIFFESAMKLVEGDQVEVAFEISGKPFAFSGEVLHCRKSTHSWGGYGIKLALDKEQRRQMRDLVFALKLLGFEMKNAPEDLATSFQLWFRDLLEGKRRAFVPELPQKH